MYSLTTSGKLFTDFVNLKIYVGSVRFECHINRSRNNYCLSREISSMALSSRRIIKNRIETKKRHLSKAQDLFSLNIYVRTVRMPSNQSKKNLITAIGGYPANQTFSSILLCRLL